MFTQSDWHPCSSCFGKGSPSVQIAQGEGGHREQVKESGCKKIIEKVIVKKLIANLLYLYRKAPTEEQFPGKYSHRFISEVQTKLRLPKMHL